MVVLPRAVWSVLCFEDDGGKRGLSMQQEENRLKEDMEKTEASKLDSHDEPPRDLTVRKTH